MTETAGNPPRHNPTDDGAEISPHAPVDIARRLKAAARDIGFELVGIAPAVTPPGHPRFLDWLDRGYAGEMGYIPRRREAYEHPGGVLQSVRSVVMLGLNYRTENPPELAGGEARISRYAWGTGDYHDVIRDRLRQLADVLHQLSPGCRTRGVVDTAPLLERDFARLAGLGWFGKNTMLINKHRGSWLFLAGLLTDVELPPDQPHEAAHCGTCTRCLEACPTDAFPEPSVLDAQRCISYLTIELRGSQIPADLREGMGDWLFGCDVCQDVCPWNGKAPRSEVPEFQPVPERVPIDPRELLQLTDETFDARFRGTPLHRTGRAAILRNAAIVLGNSREAAVAESLIEAFEDSEPLIRGAVAWALGQIGGAEAMAALQSRLRHEDNADVRGEIEAALREHSPGVSPTPPQAEPTDADLD